MKTSRICIMAISLAACSLPLFGQFDGTPAARAAYERGNTARTSGHYAEAVKDYKQAMSLDRNFAQAYQNYIATEYLAAYQGAKKTHKKSDTAKAKTILEAENKTTMGLIGRFQTLSRRHPKKAIYRWALGQIYSEDNPVWEEAYCRQSVQLDPGFAPGYQCLANVAYLRGDKARVIALRRKVMDLEPENAEAAFQYAWELQGNPAAYRDATMRMIQSFPRSPQSAQALYWYAEHQATDAAAAKYFEQLYKQFPPQQFDWSENGTEQLFDIYDRTDPAKAQKLAHEMLAADPSNKDWVAFASYADAMAKAEQEIHENNPAAALSTMKAIKSPSYDFDMRREQLLYARALDLAGKTSDAYESLLTDYAKHPTAEVHAALEQYGARAGKNSRQIDAAVWSAMKADSIPSIPFTLENLSDGEQVSLKNYRGHVVIVDFWFPNCGPCRQSFPYLQKIATEYKDKGLIVLAINGMKGQETFVLPLLKSEGYSFVPLAGSEEWDANVYHVRTYPSTFLIGEDGRVYFRPHIYNRREESATELEVNELLAHGGS